MYTILVTESNELRISVKKRIMQRSKLVDSFHFLVEKTYKDMDMSDFTIMLEYILPVSRNYHTEVLTLTDNEVQDENNRYENYLEYVLPFDTNLTAEAGEIELQLTFTKVDLDEEGNATQYVRKTSPCKITIVPIAAWSDIITDSALTALDQKMLKVDAQIKALSEAAMLYTNDKADNIVLDIETNEIYLTANGEPLGDRISIDELGDAIVDVQDEGLIQVVI